MMAAACGESAGGETMGAGDGEMLSAEETREIYGFKRGDGYVEMMCGITTSKFGEYGGMLRIFANGDLQITCQCFNGCTAGEVRRRGLEGERWRQGYEQHRAGDQVVVPYGSLQR
nr:protein ULTRAPETALA 1-like [Ipomoea batatas]